MDIVLQHSKINQRGCCVVFIRRNSWHVAKTNPKHMTMAATYMRLKLQKHSMRRSGTFQFHRLFSAGLDFNDARKCFKSKSVFDLLRSYIVFSICQTPVIVRNSERLMKTSYNIFGKRVTNIILDASFFSHFCAGQDPVTIKPTVDYLASNGVGSILDYASEADITDNEEEKIVAGDNNNSNKQIQCRVYDYRGEEVCEQHYQTFVECIRAVHAVSPTGFAAIKVTALADPKLLEAISITLTELRQLFLKFDTDKTGFVTKDQFYKAYDTFFKGGDVNKVFETLDIDHDGKIDYIEWSNGLAVEDLHKLTSFCREQGPLARAVLDENERNLMARMQVRIHNLANLAQSLGVRLMIDAEHTYFQPAIDYITLGLARKYNVSYPVIFGTYQMYLQDSKARLITDLERARKGNYKFAAKLVRGAYMVLERQRARDLGLDDPIQPSMQHTHDNYNGAVSEVIARVARGDQVEVMFASHNQGSVELALREMSQRGLGPDAPVYFGQLLGMSDNLSFSLGNAGYKAYKYVPYGKIEEVMPYLIRRAQENSDALSAAKQEINMVKKELFRRLVG